MKFLISLTLIHPCDDLLSTLRARDEPREEAIKHNRGSHDSQPLECL
jgi:hypothetical protein